MAAIFTEGFDKYGGVNSNAAGVAALLATGEWTSAAGTHTIVAALSATGQAYALGTSSSLVKTLLTNYSRLIGGIRFNSPLGANAVTLMQFRDGATAQCSITVETTGIINLRNGTVAGTILASSVAVAANSTHYLEWDITFGNSAAYQVWLDGVSAFSGTGDTTGTANNYANGIAIAVGITGSLTFDDLYLFDSTSSTNNAVLLTSPRIETTFPASDSAVQFAFGAGILGSSVSKSSNVSQPAANGLFLRSYTPAASGTLNSISIVPAITNGTINYRGVVYANSSGAPGSLMSSGTTVTGCTSGVPSILPLTTPQSLTAGTTYWIGFMVDTAVNTQLLDGGNNTTRWTATFGSGAPNPPSGGTTTVANYLFWGNLTGIAANYDEVNNNPPDGQYSYVYDSVVNHEDLYAFAPLSSPPPGIVHCVAVKAYAQKSDSGTRTVSMRTKSGATDSAGSLAGQALGTSFGWLASYFPTDPNSGAAWSATTLNAATSGFKIDS